MIKYIEVCKKIANNLNESGFPLLKEVNLHTVFEPVYDMDIPLKHINQIVCYVIYSFDPDSTWLDLRKDRLENKIRIIEGLDQNPNTSPFEDIINGKNEKINEVCLSFLGTLTDWRWTTIFSLLDYHSNMIRFVHQKTESEKSFDKMDKEGQVQTLTEDLAADTIAKINKQKGELLELAINRRKQADELLSEIKRDFVVTDSATQSDFGFNFSDTSKERVDIMSWRGFIKKRNSTKMNNI